ncbi:tRNA (adenosine(37)-N6)-threonylcarbamoyltransferase complex dimerization subunit type 1 TsaB [Candidatus Phytoplasma phoenicium]|uniref:Putative glycoprotease, family peptidase M22 n=1 Tax=Candidatus Phytoplasma phoenicium TaxID=198422 RepID=A0A0L0MJK1_9MOLU|nr:tRNA (adenosine(37)-N6)-threonylcarbamoyltransferase complex dimerization subunit type 1 TsaB [Candidatus Phytoplasma phoenicium]KND62523.1 putative glycoprotease, family peptidase M22 [Candidatus Phytoplasma phoenicium]
MNDLKNLKYIMLDISANVQLVWLISEKCIIKEKKYIHRMNFVENMMPLIHQILTETNLTLKKLNGIIVGVGPGSYIGTRLSIVTAKILALELKIPLFYISSLLLLSSGFLEQRITPKIYARKDFFYSFSLDNNQIILSENIYQQSFLNNFPNHLILNVDTLKVSPQNILKYMHQITNPHDLVPRYYGYNFQI